MFQVNEGGHRQLLLDEIIDHNHDATALSHEESIISSPNGVPRRRQTTKGWKVYVTWKDGSGNWVALKDVKDSYPVELAEYAIQAGIDKEPPFAWWVPYVMKKRNQIISKIKTKILG